MPNPLDKQMGLSLMRCCSNQKRDFRKEDAIPGEEGIRAPKDILFSVVLKKCFQNFLRKGAQALSAPPLDPPLQIM